MPRTKPAPVRFSEITIQPDEGLKGLLLPACKAAGKEGAEFYCLHERAWTVVVDTADVALWGRVLRAHGFFPSLYIPLGGDAGVGARKAA